MNYVLLIALATIFGRNCALEKKQDSNNTFVATKEWQEIAEGQGIPAGLHVRINLQTGKKEAKLLDEEDERERNQKGLALEYHPDKLELVKGKHKSYEELRATFDEMRKNFKTDAELIVQLIGEHRNLSKGEQQFDSPVLTPETRLKTQMHLLENFEYLLHQFDNALLFIENAGLEHVLLPLVVNETNTGLRVSALRVLGSLTQNNPKAQVKVFERNFGSHLAQILMTSTHREELPSALFAFGSLLRKFPHAQQRLMSTSGMQALIGVLTKDDCELKTKAKAVTLISDLVLEKRLVVDAAQNERDPTALAQYALLDFDEWLQAHGYCEAVDTLLTTQFLSFLDQPEHMDNFIVALENTKTLCRPLWSQSPQLRHALLTLKNRYAHSGDEYRVEVAQDIDKFCDDLYDKRRAHDEF